MDDNELEHSAYYSSDEPNIQERDADGGARLCEGSVARTVTGAVGLFGLPNRKKRGGSN